MNAHIYTHGENLFDEAAANKVTVGKYIDSAGVEQNNNLPGTSTLNHTSYMPVTGGTEYTYKWHGPTISTPNMIVAIVWYTSNKDFIERTTKYIQAVTDFTLSGTAPANAAYAILNFPSQTWPNSDVSLEFYDTTVEWRDYTPNMYTHGENLFDAATNNVTTGKYITLDGTIGTDPNFSYTSYMPVEANKIYKRTWTGPALVQNAGASVAWYDSTKTFIERGASTQYPAGTTSMVDNFTAPANAAYVILNFPSKIWPNPAVDLEFYDTTDEWRDGASYIYQGIWK